MTTFDGDLDEARAGDAVVVTLADEVDVSRGDMLVRPGNLPTVSDGLEAMVCWMAEEELQPTRHYILRHTTREVKAFVNEVVFRIDVDTLHRERGGALGLNDIGRVRLSTAAPVFFDPYSRSKPTGAFVLIDPYSNATVAAGMIRGEAAGALEVDVRAATRSKGTPSRAVSPDVTWEGFNISRQEREERQGHRACVVWFTGLSGAGKTTIARAVERRLFDDGVRTALLDGDHVRHGLSGDLGFSAADRTENIRRAGEVARLFFEAGSVVLCAFVSPFRADRDRVRALFPEGRFLEVAVEADLETLRARDTKGLYARAAGDLEGLTGVDAPYEVPTSAEVVLDTGALSIEDAAAEVLAILRPLLKLE